MSPRPAPQPGSDRRSLPRRKADGWLVDLDALGVRLPCTDVSFGGLGFCHRGLVFRIGQTLTGKISDGERPILETLELRVIRWDERTAGCLIVPRGLAQLKQLARLTDERTAGN